MIYALKYDLEVGGGGLVIKSCLTLVTPWQFPLFMGFSKQEGWSGLPFPSLGSLLNPGIFCTVGEFFTELLGKP